MGNKVPNCVGGWANFKQIPLLSSCWWVLYKWAWHVIRVLEETMFFCCVEPLWCWNKLNDNANAKNMVGKLKFKPNLFGFIFRITCNCSNQPKSGDLFIFCCLQALNFKQSRLSSIFVAMFPLQPNTVLGRNSCDCFQEIGSHCHCDWRYICIFSVLQTKQLLKIENRRNTNIMLFISKCNILKKYVHLQEEKNIPKNTSNFLFLTQPFPCCRQRHKSKCFSLLNIATLNCNETNIPQLLRTYQNKIKL